MSNPTPLRELYDSVTRANGWSTRDVERRIEERGYTGMKRSNVNRIINAWPLPSIGPEAIRAIAAGLGIAPERVAIAAIQSMGFRVSSESVTPAEAIARDETLSEDTRAALLSILRTAQDRRRGAS